MLIPFFLFFGLTVATAVIAYWSDNLGKKLGKKRISLLGLRPRDTATVLTIASSWGIMAFTLVVMLIVAKPLRDALFRFERLQTQNKQLQFQSNQLVSQNSQIENQLTNRENRLVQVEKEASAASKNAKTQTENARKAREDAEAALEEQRLAQGRESSARRSEAAAKRGAAQATNRAATALKGEKAATQRAQLASANLGKVQAQLDENNGKLSKTRSELDETNRDLSEANSQLDYALAKFESATKDLERIKKTAREAGQRASNAFFQEEKAKKQATEAKKQAEIAKGELDTAQQQVDALRQQQSDLQKEIAELNNTRVQLSAVVNQLSTRPVLVAVNQTLVARTLPPGLTAARVESHLRSLLALANKEVGPKLLPNSKVVLLQYIQTPDGRLIQIPSEQVFAGAADFIAASGTAVSVRLVSHSNFAEGEPEIQVRFEVVEVKTAVKADEVLAQTTVDSKIGDAAIFNALLSLVEAGRREAIRKGINPPQTPDEPNFYENGTNEQIFVALRQIERGGKTATVKIVAADDLSTVEPVRVRFDVS